MHSVRSLLIQENSNTFVYQVRATLAQTLLPPDPGSFECPLERMDQRDVVDNTFGVVDFVAVRRSQRCYRQPDSFVVGHRACGADYSTDNRTASGSLAP